MRTILVVFACVISLIVVTHHLLNTEARADQDSVQAATGRSIVVWEHARIVSLIRADGANSIFETPDGNLRAADVTGLARQIGGKEGEGGITYLLNLVGEKGWELVAIENTSSSALVSTAWYLKRQKASRK